MEGTIRKILVKGEETRIRQRSTGKRRKRTLKTKDEDGKENLEEWEGRQ